MSSHLAKCQQCGYLEDLPGRSRDQREIALDNLTHCKRAMVEVTPRELRIAKALCAGFSNALQPDLPGVPR